MIYLKFRWKHSIPDEPTLLYSELDDERWERRKVEIFADGRAGYADCHQECGDTRLGLVPVPTLADIAADPQFDPAEISKEEFELVWNDAVSRAGATPRRNALLKEGSKSDKVDARKLADLLRTGMLRPVYHGENGLRTQVASAVHKTLPLAKPQIVDSAVAISACRSVQDSSVSRTPDHSFRSRMSEPACDQSVRCVRQKKSHFGTHFPCRVIHVTETCKPGV